jgi:5-dehydro-2-deoxygluconokinase
MPAAAKFAFELVVPAESRSSLNIAGYKKPYDVELSLPDHPNHHGPAGHQVEPDVWTIEGLDRREDCKKL